ncbi:hypothetical protein, partial [Vibrio coralliilyticus]
MLRKTSTRLSFLLSSSEKRDFTFIILLSSFVSIFEIASLMLILPFLGIAINNDAIFEYRPLEVTYQWLGFDSPNDFVFFIGITLIFIYLSRVVVNIYHQRRITFFSHRVVAKFRNRLLKHNLEMKYTEFSTVNTSYLYNNILIESNNIYHIIYPIL